MLVTSISRITVLFIILFTSYQCCCQSSKITTNGIVIDKHTSKPLPFAHIQIHDYGTVTNVDGAFSINKLVPGQYLKASYMGYVTDSILISDPTEFVVVGLQPSVTQLDELVVYTGENLVRNLLNNIGKNYEIRQQMWQAYYKEKLSDTAGPLYLAEGILDIYFPANSTRYDWQISVIKSRKKTYQSNENIDGIKLRGNAYDLVQALIWDGKSFLSFSRIKNFTFKYEGYTELNGKTILIVDFEPNSKKEDVKGTMYIEQSSFALVKIKYEVDTRKNRLWDTVRWEEEYVEKEHKWYFHRMSYHGQILMGENLINLESLLVINETRNVKFQPAMGLLLEPHDFFLDEVKHLTDDFWEDYSFVKLDKSELEVVK